VHEFSLAQEVLAIAATAAREHGLGSVSEVRLAVGRLSGVSCEALAYAWDFLRREDSACAQACLAIDEPPGHGHCAHCGFDGEARELLALCPQCGAYGLQLTGGRQFAVLGLSGEPG
jgi:hydrogenase nickel incorporation protein HypA/HybF